MPGHSWIADAYDEHGAAWYRHALMIVGNAAVAEDIVHQVFVRLLRRGPAADAVLATGAYLRQAVRNECYSWLRDRRAVAIDRDDGPPRLEPAGPASPDQREVVHLKVYERCTFAEVADITGVSINTASSRYRSVARHAAQQSTLASVLRTVVAIEQFRRTAGELPERLVELSGAPVFTDPLINGPLRYRRASDSYTVYGVGDDGRDDDGDLGTVPPFSVRWWIAPEDAPDWGLRVRLREAAPTP